VRNSLCPTACSSITFSNLSPINLSSECLVDDCASFNVALGCGGLAIAFSIAAVVLHSIFTCCAPNNGVGIASIVLSTLTCFSCAGALIAWRAYEKTAEEQNTVRIIEAVTGKPKAGYSFDMMAASAAVYLLSAILSLLASRNLKSVPSMLIMPEINSGGSTTVVTSSGMQQMGVQQAGLPQQGYTPQGGYAPQQQGGYAPQQQGGYAPQQQGGYAPQQQGGYAPQQQGGSAPQQQGGYAPQQQGGYVPQQQGGYVPQRQGGYAPQPQSGYAPQQQGGYDMPQQSGYELQPLSQQGDQDAPAQGSQPQAHDPFAQGSMVHQGDGFQPQQQHPFQPENGNQNMSKNWYAGSDA
jgi:hypothetical protein